jgi:hypothetical protein
MRQAIEEGFIMNVLANYTTRRWTPSRHDGSDRGDGEWT